MHVSPVQILDLCTGVPHRPPPFYGKKLRRKLKAGASCEDLRVRCPYFYDVGCTLHSLGAATPELANFLNETFADRYKVCLASLEDRPPSADDRTAGTALSCSGASLLLPADGGWCCLYSYFVA